MLKDVKTQRDEFAHHVIDRMESALDLARKEPQKAVLIQMVARDGEHHMECTSMCLSEQVGLLEIAKHNLISC